MFPSSGVSKHSNGTHKHTHTGSPGRLPRVRWADGLCVTVVMNFDPDVLYEWGMALASEEETDSRQSAHSNTS